MSHLLVKARADISQANAQTHTQSLAKTASWVIRDKETKEVICETFSKRLVDCLKPEYEAVPILEYLQSLNKKESTR